MPDAVIVATARSPIGRANKGSLLDVRPDDLAATIVRAALAKVPQLDPAEVEDVILGCAQPAGEQGYNIGRVVALLAGMDDVPGTTVNRYCSSSLQTIRMAAHAIGCEEGDVFVAAGVECVSRFDKGRSDGGPGTTNDLFSEARARSKARAEGGAPKWTPPSGLPDVYIAMGQTAENVGAGGRHREMDEFAAVAAARWSPSRTGSSSARSSRPLPDGTVMEKDDGPGRTICRGAQLAGVPNLRRSPRACPLNDGARPWS
jgi:acetyl-CoA C-acetyltransferase